MSDTPFRALGASRVLVRIMQAFNILAGVAIVGFMVASFLFQPLILEVFSKRPTSDPGAIIAALRVWIVLAAPMLIAVHILLSKVLEVVETVGLGAPFVAENAARLKTIAWCLLIVQIFGLACGVMAGVMNAAGSHIEWHFSLTGWLAVMLLFVLARVFEEGTRLRSDLDAMI